MQANDVFDTYWPKLKDQIEAIAAETQAIDAPKGRTEIELLEENLSLTRAVLTEQQKLNQVLLQQAYAAALLRGGRPTSFGARRGTRRRRAYEQEQCTTQQHVTEQAVSDRGHTLAGGCS